MTLSETMLLLTLLATVAALLVDVAKAAFDSVPSLTVNLFD